MLDFIDLKSDSSKMKINYVCGFISEIKNWHEY